MLRAIHVAVALEYHLFLCYFNDSVIYILPRLYLCKHRIAYLYRSKTSEYHLIATILQKWAHAYPTDTECYIMSFGY